MESSALGQAVVLDSQGIVQAPNRPYAVIDQHMNAVQPGWRTVEEMTASIKRNAPEPHGLPEGAPNPNTVYLKDGQYVRYVTDTSQAAERYVSGGQVKERVRFVPRMISLTLTGARAAASAVTQNSVYKHCDFWNGFTWIRDGYIPERDFPVLIANAARSVDGAELVFEQAVSPNDEAVIRHQIAHIERSRPTLPVETAGTVAGTVVAAQSVPFPEASTVIPDGATPTEDFTPSEAPKRASGRPSKDEAA